MKHEDSVAFLSLIFPFAIIIFIMLVAYEGGMPFSLWNKLNCRLGKHKFQTQFGKVNLYFCRTCKKRRQFPVLELVVGAKEKKTKKRRG